MDIAALIQKMIQLFLTVLVGFAAAKAGVLNEERNKVLSALIVGVTNPIQVLASVLTSDHALSNLGVLQLSVIALCSYAFLIGSSVLIPKLLRVRQDEAGLYRFMYIFSNVGFIGYPLVSALLGSGATFYLTVFVLFYQLVVWSYGVYLLGGRGKFCFSPEILKRPCVVAALAAYVIYLTGLRLPAVIGRTAEMIGDMTGPLAMLVIGCSLAQMQLKSVFGRWQIYALAAIKLIFVPLLGYLVLRKLVTNELMLGVSVVVLCMPVATNTTIISYQQHADDRLASAGVFVTTLLSVVTVPLMMHLLFGR